MKEKTMHIKFLLNSNRIKQSVSIPASMCSLVPLPSQAVKHRIFFECCMQYVIMVLELGDKFRFFGD